METLSAKSKLGQYYVKAYYRSTRCTLYDAYVKPSAAKHTAFKRCQQRCEAEGGKRLRITGATCQLFTVAFEIKGPFNTTELRVITKSREYRITNL